MKISIKEEGTAFDLLAILCSLLSKEQERECDIKWQTATLLDIQKVIKKYKKIVLAVLNSSMREYIFNKDERNMINHILDKMESFDEEHKDEIYLLAREVENKIDIYSDWKTRELIYRIYPLNKNFEETGIAIYPYFSPKWNIKKSERCREHTLNSKFQNHMIIRIKDAQPFKIIMHYWNDEGLLREDENGWTMKAVVTPVSDSVLLKTESESSESGGVVLVDGIVNEEETERRILDIFDKVFSQDYSIIVFPEAVGTEKIVSEIKYKMRMHPEFCTFVLLPTFCCEGHNTLVVLGPGGIELLRSNKGTPFILRECDGNLRKEKLEYSNELHILITREVGTVAFPICAELLDPDYYKILTGVAKADTLFCPSFSPGVGAFRKTLVKGIASMMLGLWINSCSAKQISLNGEISDVISIVQLPDAAIEENPLYEIKRICQKQCDENGCYFEIDVKYHNGKFSVDSVQRRCA